jgi:NADH:ubiquinone oxidoreductase subunit H
MTGYFTVHYGFFTLIHGVFVFTFTGGGYNNVEKHELAMGPILLAWLISFIGMIVIRLSSLPPTLPIRKIMNNAYKRVIPLHLAIIAGGFAIQAFDFGNGVAVVLILLGAAAEVITQKKTSTSMNKGNLV